MFCKCNLDEIELNIIKLKDIIQGSRSRDDGDIYFAQPDRPLVYVEESIKGRLQRLELEKEKLKAVVAELVDYVYDET